MSSNIDKSVLLKYPQDLAPTKSDHKARLTLGTFNPVGVTPGPCHATVGKNQDHPFQRSVVATATNSVLPRLCKVRSTTRFWLKEARLLPPRCWRSQSCTRLWNTKPRLSRCVGSRRAALSSGVPNPSLAAGLVLPGLCPNLEQGRWHSSQALAAKLWLSVLVAGFTTLGGGACPGAPGLADAISPCSLLSRCMVTMLPQNIEEDNRLLVTVSVPASCTDADLDKCVAQPPEQHSKLPSTGAILIGPLKVEMPRSLWARVQVLRRNAPLPPKHYRGRAQAGWTVGWAPRTRAPVPFEVPLQLLRVVRNHAGSHPVQRFGPLTGLW